MTTQRYSVTPHPIQTLLSWVQSGEIDGLALMRNLVTNYFDHRAGDKGEARLTRRLEALGFDVTVTERAAAAS